MKEDTWVMLVKKVSCSGWLRDRCRDGTHKLREFVEVDVMLSRWMSEQGKDRIWNGREVELGTEER